MGCDLVQGHYLSKPVPPEAFDRFLIERAEAKAEVTPTPYMIQTIKTRESDTHHIVIGVRQS